MGFLTSLFGGETNVITVAVALAIVLVLIVLAIWLVKFVGDATSGVGRGRNRRLLVIDSIPIDNKRQAVIIRRDETEHLIVIGGPNDLVVESGFEAPQVQRVQRRVPASEPAVHPAPAPEPLHRPAPKSLRHTGLLRPVTDDEPSIDGGNSDKTGRLAPDSAKSVAMSASITVDPEPVIEPREREYAEHGTIKP
ncbi:flagellar biosynthetic protein FliO [Pelagibacterium lacus]|uniref:flagellar biosynthetic protein FliO n=1 Tax=Pelagibacterium lacus TaxID=2282655 RepID=UPI0013143EBD|nr:flagellar biosynthetic protein FliO [Pelagibacterium lacus]